jgi:hypothetical protein
MKKIEKQGQQGRVAFNECNPTHDPAIRIIGKEPSRTQNKNRLGHTAKHVKGDYFNDT